MTGGSLTGLLTSGGAPAALSDDVTAALGPQAAEVLLADPWRLLDVRRVRPEQVDAWALRVGGAGGSPAGAADPRRAVALTAWLLRRAAADGHTAVPATGVARALAGLDVSDPATAVRAACEAGRCVAVPAEGSALLALPELAEAEEALAEGLERLTVTAEPEAPGGEAAGKPGAPDEPLDAVLGHGVVGVEAPAGTDPHTEVARWERALGDRGLRLARAGADGLDPRAAVLAAADVAVVERAEQLDVPAAAGLVAGLRDGARLVLVGDPALLPPAGPGRVLADVRDAGTVPWVRLPAQRAGAPGARIASLVAAVRRGELPPAADDADREVVLAPTSDDRAVGMAVRLATRSIPAAFEVPAEQVLVVSPRRGGVAGARSLHAALCAELGERAQPRAQTVHAARSLRVAAAVVVLPAEAAGVLARDLVATAFGLADRHLSVVTSAGAALRAAVAHVPGRPRRTRLAALLAEP